MSSNNNTKKVALVTGANQGIGQEVARQLAQDHDIIVLVGARDLSKGQTAADAIGKDAHAIQIDVTDAASIAAAAERVTNEFGRLDILVNNAGIHQCLECQWQVRTARPSTLHRLQMCVQCLKPMCLESSRSRRRFCRCCASRLPVALSTSAVQLVRWRWWPTPSLRFVKNAGAYSASKTALNAVTLSFAIELESTPIKVNAVCPGYVATALNGFAGPRTVAQGATEIIRLALLGPDGPTGAYRNEDGPIAW
jgi:NAD(P)-dependent dehydrogenase (short-subunit alcohol dehydrogenase family)